MCVTFKIDYFTSYKFQNSGDFLLPKNVANVFVPLISKHPDKRLSKTLLLLWLLKTISEHLVLPANMSTSKFEKDDRK